MNYGVQNTNIRIYIYLRILQGPELASKNDLHGTVVWNGRVWVWYHNRYPHTIRFDYDPKTSTFRHRPSPGASGEKSNIQYADWVLEKGVLRCNVAQGKRGVAGGNWKVEGDVPVCAVLLAGMSEILIENSKSA